MRILYLSEGSQPPVFCICHGIFVFVFAFLYLCIFLCISLFVFYLCIYFQGQCGLNCKISRKIKDQILQHSVFVYFFCAFVEVSLYLSLYLSFYIHFKVQCGHKGKVLKKRKNSCLIFLCLCLYFSLYFCTFLVCLYKSNLTIPARSLGSGRIRVSCPAAPDRTLSWTTAARNPT